MARLLTDKDYLKVTLSDTVRELITEHYNQWLDAEQAAQLEAASYLSQRYITNQIFTNTTTFDSLITYKAKNLVEYTESEYNQATSYSVGNRVKFLPPDSEVYYIYECISAAEGIAPDNTTYWVKCVQDKTMYFVTNPAEDWDKDADYAVGDEVFYLDKVYTAVVANNNIIPSSNTGVWGSGTSYSISAGLNPDIEYHTEITYALNDKVTYKGNLYTAKGTTTGNLPTNGTYWTAETDSYEWTLGDNRNQLIVRFLLDITLYHFMRSVPARAIPDHIKEAYNGNSAQETGGAIGWLKNVAKGMVNADLPELVATTPNYSIMHGQARDKQDNQLW